MSSEGPWPGERSPAQTGVWSEAPVVIGMKHKSLLNPRCLKITFLLYSGEGVHVCVHVCVYVCMYMC